MRDTSLDQIDPVVRALDNEGRSRAIRGLPTIDEPLSDEVAGLATVDSRELESSHVIRTRPRILYSCSGYMSNAAIRYIQIFDAVALPPNGAIPKLVTIAPAGPSSFAFTIPTRGIEFLNGIVVAISTTGPTLTLGAAEMWVNAAVQA